MWEIEKYSIINHSFVSRVFINCLWDESKGQKPCQTPGVASKTAHFIIVKQNTFGHIAQILKLSLCLPMATLEKPWYLFDFLQKKFTKTSE